MAKTTRAEIAWLGGVVADLRSKRLTWSEAWFKKIAADAYLINASSAIIDGEIVVPAADGTTDFSVLQNELRGKSTKIVMVAFDVL